MIDYELYCKIQDCHRTQHLSVAQIANTLGYVFQSPSHMLFAPTINEELTFGPTNLHHSSACARAATPAASRSSRTTSATFGRPRRRPS